MGWVVNNLYMIGAVLNIDLYLLLSHTSGYLRLAPKKVSYGPGTCVNQNIICKSYQVLILNMFKVQWHICDVIKQNQSEVGNIDFEI